MRFASIAASAVALGVSAPVLAAPPSKNAATANRVALIDFQVAILQTEEGKAAKAKIEREVESRKKELLAQQQELKKLEDDFEAKRAVLSEDEKNKSARDLQAKFMAFQRSQMTLDQEVRQKEMQETQKIFQNYRRWSKSTRRSTVLIWFSKKAPELFFTSLRTQTIRLTYRDDLQSAAQG